MPSINGVSNATYAPSTTRETNSDLKADDFLQLMIAQLKNQDFMNPVDDTEYLSQLAQFTTMQHMNELAEKSQQSYLLSLVGTNVTAAKYDINGGLQTETGVIQKISLVDGENLIYVNGTSFSLEQIMELNATDSKPSINIQNDVEDLYGERSFLMSLIGKRVTAENADGEEVTGIVNRISMNDGFKFYMQGEWLAADQLVEVDTESGVKHSDDSDDDEIPVDTSLDADRSDADDDSDE